ncbi:MAG: hypothetical protein IKD90_03685 [Clostridiales bacterium]|nr:hypothetical protein [Clostridiales bacterium]
MNKQKRARQILLYALYITSVCCLQVTFPGFFRLFGRTADLMLVFTVFAGYLFGPVDGIVVGLIVGLFRDYFSGPVVMGLNQEPVALLGIGMLSFMYIGLLSALLFRKRFRRKLFLGILQVELMTLIYYVSGHVLSYIYFSVSRTMTSYHSLRYVVVSCILPQLLVNAIAALPILLVLRFIGPYSKGVRSALVDGYSMEDKQWQSV